MHNYPSYSVVIRTLGRAGTIYERLIASLRAQSHPPIGIHVYLAEGYQRPPQVADEYYHLSPKGMVSQRALQYDEIEDDYILFCDDDVFLPADSVSTLFDSLLDYNADCIAPNVFPNHEWSFKQKCIAAFFYGTLPSILSKYAFRIRRSSYYSYALRPKTVMRTQSFAGPCFLIRKKVFLNAHFEEERWLDSFRYANGEDQMLAYKLYTKGYSLLIHYNTGIIHADARTSQVDSQRERFYNNGVIRYVIWYRSIYQVQKTFVGKIISTVCYYAFWTWSFLLSILSRGVGKSTYKMKDSITSLLQARKYVDSAEFRRIPVWTVNKAT